MGGANPPRADLGSRRALAVNAASRRAKEGRAVTIGCCQAVRKEDIPDGLAFKSRYLADVGAWVNPGGSVIVDPDAKILARPANETEGILYADIRADQLVGPRWQLDIAGHYARAGHLRADRASALDADDSRGLGISSSRKNGKATATPLTE